MSSEGNVPPALKFLAVVLVLACAWGLKALLFQAFLRSEPVARIIVPGDRGIAFAQPGAHTLFHEFRSALDGRVFEPRDRLPKLDCALINKSTGQAAFRRTGIDLQPSRSEIRSRYAFTDSSGARREAVSLLKFQIERPGEYEFKAVYAGQAKGPDIVVTIRRQFGLRISGVVLAILAITFGAAAIYIFLRKRALPATPALAGEVYRPRTRRLAVCRGARPSPGKRLFQETQRFSPKLRWLKLAILLLAFGVAGRAIFLALRSAGDESPRGPLFWALLCLPAVVFAGLLVLLAKFKVTTEVCGDGIHIRATLIFRRTIGAKSLKEIRVIPLPRWSKRGCDVNFFTKRRRYVLSGDRAVEFTLVDGWRVQIASNRPEELAQAMAAMAGMEVQ